MIRTKKSQQSLFLYTSTYVKNSLQNVAFLAALYFLSMDLSGDLAFSVLNFTYFYSLNRLTVLDMRCVKNHKNNFINHENYISHSICLFQIDLATQLLRKQSSSSKFTSTLFKINCLQRQKTLTYILN